MKWNLTSAPRPTSTAPKGMCLLEDIRCSWVCGEGVVCGGDGLASCSVARNCIVDETVHPRPQSPSHRLGCSVLNFSAGEQLTKVSASPTTLYSALWDCTAEGLAGPRHSWPESAIPHTRVCLIMQVPLPASAGTRLHSSGFPGHAEGGGEGG